MTKSVANEANLAVQESGIPLHGARGESELIIDVAGVSTAVGPAQRNDNRHYGKTPSLTRQLLRAFVEDRKISPVTLLFQPEAVMDFVRAVLGAEGSAESLDVVRGRWHEQNLRLEDDQDVGSETTKDSGSVLADERWQAIGRDFKKAGAVGDLGRVWCQTERDRRLAEFRGELARRAADGELDLVEQRELVKIRDQLGISHDEYDAELERVETQDNVTVIKPKPLTNQWSSIKTVDDLRRLAGTNPQNAELALVQAIDKERLHPWLAEQDLGGSAAGKVAYKIDMDYSRVKPDEQAKFARKGAWQTVWALGEPLLRVLKDGAQVVDSLDKLLATIEKAGAPVTLLHPVREHLLREWLLAHRALFGVSETTVGDAERLESLAKPGDADYWVMAWTLGSEVVRIDGTVIRNAAELVQMSTPTRELQDAAVGGLLQSWVRYCLKQPARADFLASAGATIKDGRLLFRATQWALGREELNVEPFHVTKATEAAVVAAATSSSAAWRGFATAVRGGDLGIWSQIKLPALKDKDRLAKLYGSKEPDDCLAQAAIELFGSDALYLPNGTGLTTFKSKEQLASDARKSWDVVTKPEALAVIVDWVERGGVRPGMTRVDTLKPERETLFQTMLWRIGATELKLGDTLLTEIKQLFTVEPAALRSALPIVALWIEIRHNEPTKAKKMLEAFGANKPPLDVQAALWAIGARELRIGRRHVTTIPELLNASETGASDLAAIVTDGSLVAWLEQAQNQPKLAKSIGANCTGLEPALAARAARWALGSVALDIGITKATTVSEFIVAADAAPDVGTALMSDGSLELWLTLGLKEPELAAKVADVRKRLKDRSPAWKFEAALVALGAASPKLVVTNDAEQIAVKQGGALSRTVTVTAAGSRGRIFGTVQAVGDAEIAPSEKGFHLELGEGKAASDAKFKLPTLAAGASFALELKVAQALDPGKSTITLLFETSAGKTETVCHAQVSSSSVTTFRPLLIIAAMTGIAGGLLWARAPMAALADVRFGGVIGAMWVTFDTFWTTLANGFMGFLLFIPWAIICLGWNIVWFFGALLLWLAALAVGWASVAYIPVIAGAALYAMVRFESTKQRRPLKWEDLTLEFVVLIFSLIGLFAFVVSGSSPGSATALSSSAPAAVVAAPARTTPSPSDESASTSQGAAEAQASAAAPSAMLAPIVPPLPALPGIELLVNLLTANNKPAMEALLGTSIDTVDHPKRPEPSDTQPYLTNYQLNLPNKGNQLMLAVLDGKLLRTGRLLHMNQTKFEQALQGFRKPDTSVVIEPGTTVQTWDLGGNLPIFEVIQGPGKHPDQEWWLYDRTAYANFLETDTVARKAFALVDQAKMELAQSSPDRDAAREHFQAALELQPSYARTWLRLCLLEHEAGNLDAAKKSCEEATTRTLIDYVRTSANGELKKIAAEVVSPQLEGGTQASEAGQLDVKASGAEALVAFKQHDYLRAAQLWQQLVDAKAARDMDYSNASYAWFGAKRFNECVDLASRCIGTVRNTTVLAMCRYNRGMCQREKGQIASARTDFEVSLSLRDNDAVRIALESLP